MQNSYTTTYAQRVTSESYQMLLRLVTVALSMTLILGITTKNYDALTTSFSNSRAANATFSRVKPTSTAKPLRVDVRLVAISRGDEHRGIVEVLYNGEWGIVCDDYWNFADARVVCQQLGYADAISALTNLVATPERTDFLLDDVICNGTEASIDQCDHDPWKQHDCGARELAGVTCLVKEDSTLARDSCEPYGNFYCASTGDCVHMAQRCNGVIDCFYGEDEAGCKSSPIAPQRPITRDACLSDEKFYCEDAKRCIWPDWRCDGRSDCSNSEDEINCTTANLTRHTSAVSPCGSTIYGSGHFQSPNYPAFYDNDLHCNWTLVASPYYGRILIKVYAFSTNSGSDFLSIYNKSGHLVYRLSGIDISSSLYIDNFAVVNFTTDSAGASSGFSMSFSTGVSQAHLPREICVLKDFYCEISELCAPMSYRCNGYRDCTYGEDEQECSTSSGAPTTTQTSLSSCLEQGNFYCEYSGECIAMWHHCDGYSNCTYGEDELGCDQQTSRPQSPSALCGGAFNGSGVISSPNYPQAYPNNVFCSWKLQSYPPAYVLVVTFQSFNTEAKSDVVRVYYDNYLIDTYSGSTLPPKMVLGKRGKITFISDRNTSAKGFSFTFGSYERSKAVARELSRGRLILVSGYIASIILGLPRFGQY